MAESLGKGLCKSRACWPIHRDIVIFGFIYNKTTETNKPGMFNNTCTKTSRESTNVKNTIH